jgi:hypothetical protein
MSVMSQEKEKSVHPLVKLALDLAYQGAEPIAFADWAIQELKDSLSEYFGKPDLLQAVVDLLNLASLLEKEGAPTAALGIIMVVATAAEPLQEMTKKDTPAES